MAVWPETLPQEFLHNSFKDSEPDLVVREQMDSGPPIVRKICTANVRPFEGSMVITLAQKAILSAFYRSYCAIPFDFPHPDTGSLISVMFAEKPSYSNLSGGVLHQVVELKLEQMP